MNVTLDFVGCSLDELKALLDGEVEAASLLPPQIAMAEQLGLRKIIEKVEPSEIYNLGAQSHVMVSFEQPEYTGDVSGLGATRLLEAIRETGIQTRLYQAASSEMFGDSSPPQSEDTPFRPRSPYAAAKLYAYWLTRNYREAYGM